MNKWWKFAGRIHNHKYINTVGRDKHRASESDIPMGEKEKYDERTNERQKNAEKWQKPMK